MAKDLAFILSSMATFLTEKWYFVLIPLLIIAIILLWVKASRKAKIEYYSQIEENKKLGIKELEYNPTEIKWIYHVDRKYKVYGELFLGYIDQPKPMIKQQIAKEYSQQEVRDILLEQLKEKLKVTYEPQYIAHVFAVRRKNIFNWLFFGEKDQVLLMNNEYTRVKVNAIRINGNARLIYRDGFIVTTEPHMINIVSDRTERLSKDHLINATGQQQKDFSRIRTDYAHEEVVKEKEAEIEKEKRKGGGHVGG
jgi:hypothetical protein